MKTIGMIGGLSWVSAAEYYKRLNQITQERLGGVNSARLVLASVNREDYYQAVHHLRDEAAACEVVRSAARSVEKAGVDFIIIACNDAHRFVPAIKQTVSTPFLHIAEATARHIRSAGLKRIALLGSRKTMEGDFYVKIFDEYGISTVIPNDGEKDYIDGTINSELVKNIFRDETRSRYLRIMGDLCERGAEGVALACTEIPLLVSPEQTDVPCFSTTEIHCQSAVSLSLG